MLSCANNFQARPNELFFHTKSRPFTIGNAKAEVVKQIRKSLPNENL